MGFKCFRGNVGSTSACKAAGRLLVPVSCKTPRTVFGLIFPCIKRIVSNIFVVLQTGETNVQHHLEDRARAVAWHQGC